MAGRPRKNPVSAPEPIKAPAPIEAPKPAPAPVKTGKVLLGKGVYKIKNNENKMVDYWPETTEVAAQYADKLVAEGWTIL